MDDNLCRKHNEHCEIIVVILLCSAVSFITYVAFPYYMMRILWFHRTRIRFDSSGFWKFVEGVWILHAGIENW
jgi:hypothetical protein